MICTLQRTWRGAFLGVLAVALAGCFSQDATKQKASQTGAKKAHVHDHPDKGPHGGPLAEWGDEEYHVEFTADRVKKQVTVYILDGNAGKAVPIEAKTLTLTLKKEVPPLQVKLAADPQPGEPANQASRFSGTHEKFGKELDPGDLDISGEVKGKPYEGSFDEADHKSKSGGK